MSIPNYGKKLILDGVLVAKPVLIHPHDYHEIWAPDFMESIIFNRASKQKYCSVLHFFWQTIFHQREVLNQTDADEIFSATHLYKTSLKGAVEKIKQITPNWYEQNHKLIPNAKWVHFIWDDINDVFITFEDDDAYFGWSWDSTIS